MIVDVKLDMKNGKLLLIKNDNTVDEVDLINPYFYTLLNETGKRIFERAIKNEDCWLEETNFEALIYDSKADTYIINNRYKPYRVVTTSPNLVPKYAELLTQLRFRISAHNVRYVIRNAFDRDIEFLDVVPIYYGFDYSLIRKISNVEGIIIDVEVVQGKPKLVSVLKYRPFMEIVKDNVESILLPEGEDRLQALLSKYPVIYGHNIIGFDIPVLERYGFVINKDIKLLFDTSYILSTYSASLGVGSARSLLDVAMVMKDEVGITDKEIEIKKAVKGRVDNLSTEDLIKYNVNDVVLTAKILNSIAPFIYSISAVSQVPPSEVMNLPSGMVAEYSLLRMMEIEGVIPEYRPSNARLVGERVYLLAEKATYNDVLHLDIKAMYPNYVLNNYIDPTLHIGNKKFNREAGLGPLYSFLRRFYEFRLITRGLKKQDPRFKPIDSGVKAILNALAYGVQGKQSGYAIMGNKYCPEKIFYGTREVQFSTIDYLRSKGYTVIYGDTDSFFILRRGRDPNEILKLVNEYLRKYGLEADLEEIWDYMFIYSKKNYIVRKGDKLIIKGSALHNLDKIYLPECISLSELLRIEDRDARLEYINEAVMNADVADLLFRGHQQVWRLIGKDLQAWKRLGERKSRYLTVLTPWNEKPVIVLKKGHISHLLMPHSAPIFKFFLDGKETLDVSTLEPFHIVELRSARFTDSFIGLKARLGEGDLLVYEDRFYILSIHGIWYGLRLGSKEFEIPYSYSKGNYGRSKPLLQYIKAKVKVRKVNIDEDVLRSVVLDYVKKTLRRYGFL